MKGEVGIDDEGQLFGDDLLADVLGGARVAIVRFDEKGHLCAGGASLRRLGFEYPAQEDAFAWLSTLAHPDDHGDFAEALTRVHRGGHGMVSGDARMRCDERYRWIRWTFQRSGDRLVGVFQDVSDLKGGEHMLRQLLEHAPLPVFLKDAERCFRFANAAERKALSSIVGRDLDSVVGLHHRDLDPESAALVEGRDVEMLRSGESTSFVDSFETPDGPFHVNVNLFPVPGPDGRLGVGGVALDVTARCEAEKVVARQAEELKRLVQNMPMGVVTYRHVPETGRLVLVRANSAADEVLVRGASFRKGEAMLDILLEAERAAHWQRLADVAMNGGGFSDRQAVHADGYPRRVFENVTFQSAPGEVTSVFRDVSEHERLKAGLVEARQVAEDALRAKGNFLANMSHEIRTPLHGILGAAELLAKTRSPTEREELSELIRRSGQALLVIINDILDFSKIESGRLTLESVPVDVPQLVREAVELFRPQASDKGIDLKIEIEAGMHTIAGDPTRLRQVLLNLVSNAVKFTQRGSVTASGCMMENESGWTLRLVVRDSGIGMSSEELERIFHRFSQADSSTTRIHGGTGLGTSISQGLVELMGGTLSVESELGTGTAFTVEVPVVICDSEYLHAKPPERDKSHFEGRVLLVEDNRVNQTIGKKILQGLGLEVVVAGDGAQALELSVQSDPDLILMDIQMPVMDGLEVTRRLVDSGATVPIVAMTANVMREDVQAYRAAGMVGHVPKPFQLREVIAVLQQHLPQGARSPQDRPKDVVDDPG
ncbi:MAG: ATP-binding protein [Myxococcales bacterium]|nr:ATP-binding protein [Myxococcales bacterium]